jgi:hypothetical protein
MTTAIFPIFAALVAASTFAIKITPPTPVAAAKTGQPGRSVKPRSVPAKLHPKPPADRQRSVHAEPHPTPSPERVVVQDLGKHYCIGGTLCANYCEDPAKNCEAKTVYSLRFDRPTRVSRIELYASDDEGLTRMAELVVKLDGRDLGTFPVQWTGSAVSAPVHRSGELLTIEARDRSSVGYAGEGAVISAIYVFGGDLQ